MEELYAVGLTLAVFAAIGAIFGAYWMHWMVN